MINSIALSKNNYIFYDIENKIIARNPTKSNLKTIGSDNSLYFGMVDNHNMTDILCKVLDLNNIVEGNGKQWIMKASSFDVEVVLNINTEGQIQVKLCKDGTMNKISTEYAFNEMKEIDFTKMLIVIDFGKKEIRFKDPKELCL